MAAAGKTELDAATTSSRCSGRRSRASSSAGESDLGDKTLLDALVPAVDELEAATHGGGTPGDGLPQRAAVTARERAEATSEMLAKRGRASYTGERSIGTLDAGAVGVAVMFERLAEIWPADVNRAEGRAR